jgi:hypothetical protein
MNATAAVRRPTEDAADLNDRPMPPVIRIADLLITARATGDRYGELLFDKMLDRAMGGAL